MRLSHILVAGATAVSFSAFAADEQKSQQQPQAQGSSQSQSASGGATQSSGAGQSGGAQQASQSQETIKQAQEKLSAAGHEVQADGIMGPKTQAALKEFQQQKGLQASGQLDQQTLSALGVSEGASASTGASAEKSGAGASQESASGASSQGAAGGASAEPKSESKEKSKY
jgi:peptidoglycan hydrolase-like protein with peptidoglycan-binding domain